MNNDNSYGDKAKGHENNKEDMKISMTKIYSASSLESGKVRDFLKSFSNTSLEIRDSLECSYHTKQKCEKKCKLSRDMKPYSRKSTESKTNSHSLRHSKSHLSALEHKLKEEMKNTTNTKSLKVKNINGTTTEVTLKPIVLMHVREIPANSLPNNKEIYHVVPNSSPQMCQLNMDPKVVTETYESRLRRAYENLNHSNTNILRVKSSRNSTNLSAERKLSCMKTSKNNFDTSENFRRPNSSLCHNGKNCINSKKSLISLPTCTNVCHNLIPDYNRSLEAFFEKSKERKEITNVSSGEWVRHPPYANYSITTVYRHPAPRFSNTSSGYNQGDVYYSPQPSDAEMRK